MPDSDKTPRDRVAIAANIIAAIVLVAALSRVFGGAAIRDRIDGTTLTYLAVAVAIVFMRDVKSLAFGDYRIEFERTKQIAIDAKNTAETAQGIALGTGRTEGQGGFDTPAK